jgi:hypothetical protein
MMDQTTQTATVQAIYTKLVSLLADATKVAQEAAEAAQQGNLPTSRGAALEAEGAVAEALRLLAAATVVHGLK